MSEARAWARIAVAGLGKYWGLPVDTGAVFDRVFAQVDAERKKRARELTERIGELLAALLRSRDSGLGSVFKAR